MRLIPAVCALAALAFAQSAGAVTLAPVSFSPEFQTKLSEELGTREGEFLRNRVEEAVRQALSQRGVDLNDAGGAIEIVIVDANPNRPTMQQLAAQPGLDLGRSISIGGAELRAVLRGPGGEVLTEVDHRRYNHTITEVAEMASTTWSEAQRSIRAFANKVADAYVAHSGR